MANVKVNNDGPYIVSGEVELVDADGNAFTKNETFGLCRCGASENKPFCDGAHKRIEFKSELNAG